MFYLYLAVLSCFIHVQLFATLQTVVHWVLLFMVFSRQAYCSGLPCPPLGDLPDPGFKPKSLMSPALADGFITTSTTWEALISYQFGSVAQPCPNLCNPMDHSTPGFPVHHQFPELAQTHVHRVSDLILCCSLLLQPSNLQIGRAHV